MKNQFVKINNLIIDKSKKPSRRLETPRGRTGLFLPQLSLEVDQDGGVQDHREDSRSAARGRGSPWQGWWP